MGDHSTTNVLETNGIRDNEFLEGILVSRARGKTFTSLILAKIDSHKEDPTDFGLVRLRFPSTESSDQDAQTAKELRSFCRRHFKIGDRLKIALANSIRPEPDSTDRDDEMARQTIRIVVDCPSQESATEQVKILASRHWDSRRCQQFQDRWKAGREHPPKPRKRKLPANDSCVDNNGHGSGRAKMAQAEHLANFLVDMIVLKLLRETQNPIEETPEHLLASMPPSQAQEWRSKAIEYLNTGGGVCDVAGGSGHVSMALGLLGVQSTVIDPRERVGMLPGRERKVWKRALQKQQPSVMCHPVVPYQKRRSWFGVAPDGVDSAFRHPDRETVSVCNEDSSLVNQASAIVALHPDEATGEAVRVAVAKKIPFVVVPCCVFARLFPLRRIRSTQQSVGTYPELVRYLQEQDASIRQHQFPFAGRNTALWSIF